MTDSIPTPPSTPAPALWPDLAAERLGGAVLAANDEFFAPKENLLKPGEPVWVEDRYTDRGKWMDGWETRRRRTPGHDWAIVRLGTPGILREVVVNTRHFKGNYPERFSLEATSAPGDSSPEELAGGEIAWTEVLPPTPLAGDRENRFPVASPYRFTHLRLNIFPDGGVARLRVHGEIVPDPHRLAGEIDLAAATLGGRATASSDGFFGSPHKLLRPGPATHMGDGWETRRRRGPGHDWAIVRLAVPGRVRHVEVDTTHFKGNAPGSCSLEGCEANGEVPEEGAAWREIRPRTDLVPDTLHLFKEHVQDAGAVTHVRLNIFPDGGVARLRLYGEASEAGRRAAGLRWLDSLPPAEAARELLSCCGSREWARRMEEERPFADPGRLAEAAGSVWRALSPEDWREALAAHPRIGERSAGEPSGEATSETKNREAPAPAGGQAARWSAAEQSGTAVASGEVLAALAEANREYEERFGMTFIVCASGKSAEEMLALCRERMGNDPGTELRVAAEEQLRIARLRLEKLLRGEG
jgi:allantoicase